VKLETVIFMKNSVLILVVLISFIACKKKQEPQPQICFGKEIYKYKDTIVVSNCSKYYTGLRWVMPDGTQTKVETIYFVPSAPNIYTFTIYVNNNDYITEYKTTKSITVTP
jgi:hypothetical protein